MKYYEAEATGSLYERLIALSADWETEDSCRGYRTNTEEDLRDRRIFVAEEDGAIVGYLFGLTQRAEGSSTVMDAGTAFFELEELYVIPRRRSQGIGRRLFALAEQAARAEGITHLLLSTATKDWRAILHFYIEELGMDFWSARLFKKLD